MAVSREISKLKPIRKNGGRVKEVFDEAVKQIADGKKPVISRIMVEKGYSQSSANCVKVTQTATWKQLINNQDKYRIFKVFDDLIDESNEDKRTRLSAAIELCKLHDLYPGKKLKIESQQEKNNQFIEYEEVDEAEVE
jgi:hypothetical protein